MKQFFSLLLSFISFTAIAQESYFTISGKVVDAVTKRPLPAASVFAQNTTYGTATDTSGYFSLRLFNGGYDLVVTYTGYENTTRRISTADAADKNIVIEIRQKDKSMEAVAIVASNEVKDGWEKYGDFFIENFIGKTANSRQCIIKNKEAIKFYYSKRKNRLKVLATAPLEIENPALGYHIRYTLDSFTHEYATQVSTFTGYPFFEEMIPANDAEKSNWYNARLKAYNGSILHFMRSVYNKTLKEEGFEIQFITKNNELETAIPLKDFYGALNYTTDDSTRLVDITLNQPDMAVLYMNEKPDSDYLAQNENSSGKFQLSVINIPKGQWISIEQNGYYFDQNDITITEWWTWEKIGDMLPYDFKP